MEWNVSLCLQAPLVLEKGGTKPKTLSLTIQHKHTLKKDASEASAPV